MRITARVLQPYYTDFYMDKTNTTEEEVKEVTTIENQPSQQVVKKTVRQVEPQAKGEPAQKVYNTKKSIFRFNQIIWYILALIEVLLIFRIILKMLGANPNVGFTSFIYALTSPLALPFSGILGASISGNSMIEWSTVIACLVYLCVAWGIVYLLDLVYPITPKDVETQ